VAVTGRSSARAAAAVLALYAAGLTVSLGWTAAKSARRIEKAFLYAGESALAERSREFGASYAREIEAIRRAIPQDGAYALVDGDPVELGGALWVRFDLEPRRAVFLGLRKGLPRAAELRCRIPPEVRWVVIGFAKAPPVLVDLDRFLAERP
jgi:hypothetical protein